MKITYFARCSVAGLMLLGAASSARAQAPAPAAPLAVEHTARTNTPAVAAVDHPLKQALDLATASLERTRQVSDLAYTFVKREEVDGKLGQHEAMFMKVRQQPFSVYVHTLGPVQPKGQEAIYVEGQNKGKILVHLTGFRHKLVGTIALAPDSPEIMDGNRYSLTSAGPQNMLLKIIAFYQREMADPQTEVQTFVGAKVDGRSCTCVQVSHPQPKPGMSFQMTRIFYDDEIGLPIRWEAYEWPKQPGESPRLVEEYTYRNVQLNCGLTDADFDTKNEKYGFN